MKKSAEVLGEPRVNLSGELGRKEETFKADIALKDGDVIPFGNDEFKVILHTGSYNRRNLFGYRRESFLRRYHI